MNQPLTPRVASLVGYVAGDSLVGQQWEERPLVLGRSNAPEQGYDRDRKWESVGWRAGQGEDIGDLGNSI